MNLNDALDLFFLSHYSEIAPTTEKWYRVHLRTLPRVLGNVPVEEITPAMLYRWRKVVFERPTRFGRPPSRETCDGYIRACHRFFNWLVEEGIVKASPAAKLKRLGPDASKPPKAISLRDFKRLVDFFARENKLRNLAITLFLLDTGCRVETVNNLRLCDVDAANLRAWTVEKGRRGRWLFFHPVTMTVIDRYVYEQRPDCDTDHVFVSQRRRPLHPQSVQRMLKIAGRKAGCTGPVNPHAFRHAFAIENLKRGMSLSSVSELLGHADIATTHQYYARWQVSELQRQHDRHSPLPSLMFREGAKR